MTPQLKATLELDGDKWFVTMNKVKSELSTLDRAFDGAARRASEFENKFKAGANGLHSTVVTLGALRFAMMDMKAVFFDMPAHIAKTAGEFQRMETLMEGLSKKQNPLERREEARQSTNDVIRMSQNAPFDVKALSDSFVKFKSAGLDPMTMGFKTLVDGVSKFGGSSETLKRASVAIQQMVGKGTVSLEELRQQLGEAVPDAMRYMAQGMGMSMDELVKKVSNGQVKAKEAIAKMFAQMEIETRGSAERMMQTFPGALERLKTEFALFEKGIADQGFLTSLGLATKDLADELASPEGKAFAKDLGESLRDGLQGVIGFFKEIKDNIGVIGFALRAAFDVYAGSKMATMVQGLTQRYREQREEMIKTRQAANDLAKDKLRAANAADGRYLGDLSKEGKKLKNADKIMTEGEAPKFKQIGEERAKLLGDLQTHHAKLEAAEKLHQQKMAKLRDMETEFSKRKYGPDDMWVGKKRGFIAANPIAGAAAQAVDLEGAAQRKAKYEEEMKGARAAAAESKRLTMEKIALLNAEEAAHLNNSKKRAAEISVIDATTKKVREDIQARNKQIEAFKNFNAAAGVAGQAMLNFGKNLGASLLFGAAFELAARGIMMLLDKISEKARNAEAARQRAVDIDAGRVSEDQIKQRAADITNTEAEIKDLTTTSRKGLFGEDIEIAESVEEGAERHRKLNAAILKLAKLKEDQARAQKLLASTQAQDVASSRIAEFDLNLKAETDKLRNKLNADSAELQSAIAFAEKVGNKEKAKKLRQELADQTNLSLANLEFTRVDERVGSLSKMLMAPGMGDDKALLAELRTMRDRRQTLQEQIDTIKSSAIRESTKKGAGAGNDKIGMAQDPDSLISPQERLRRRLQDELEAQMAELRMKADGVISWAEIYDAAVKKAKEAYNRGELDETREVNKPDGKGGTKKVMETFRPDINEGGENGPTVQKFARTMASIEANKQANPVIREYQNLMRDMPALEQFAEEQLNGEDIARKKVDPFKDLLNRAEQSKDALLPALKEIGVSWEEFQATLARGSALKAAPAIAKTMEDLNTQIAQMAEASESDEIAREERKTAKAIEEMRKRVNAHIAELQAKGTLSEEDTARVEKLQERLNQFILAKNTELMRNLRSPVQQMVDEWKKGFEAVQGAATKFMNGLVDTIVDQNFSLKLTDIRKMLDSFVKDIAKAKLRQTIASAVTTPGEKDKNGVPTENNLLQTGTNWLAESLGMGKKKPTGAQGDPLYVTDAAKSATTKGAEEAAEAAGDKAKEAFVTFQNKSVEMIESMKTGVGSVLDSMSISLRQLFNSMALSGSGDSGGNPFVSFLGNLAGSYFGQPGAGLSVSGEGASISGNPGMNAADDWMLAGLDAAPIDFTTMPVPQQVTEIKNKFANGGVMTQWGSLPMRAYSTGGIARRPQLAVYGEGRRPEAYVPLPDGRTIPVTMSGGDATGVQMPAVSVNVINQTGQQVQATQQGSPRIDGKQMILDVVLSGVSAPGPFRDAMRSAVSK